MSDSKTNHESQQEAKILLAAAASSPKSVPEKVLVDEFEPEDADDSQSTQKRWRNPVIRYLPLQDINYKSREKERYQACCVFIFERNATKPISASWDEKKRKYGLLEGNHRCTAAHDLGYTHIASSLELRCIDPPFPTDQMKHYHFKNHLDRLTEIACNEVDPDFKFSFSVSVPNFSSTSGVILLSSDKVYNIPIQASVEADQDIGETRLVFRVDYQTLQTRENSLQSAFRAIKDYLANEPHITHDQLEQGEEEEEDEEEVPNFIIASDRPLDCDYVTGTERALVRQYDQTQVWGMRILRFVPLAQINFESRQLTVEEAKNYFSTDDDQLVTKPIILEWDRNSDRYNIVDDIDAIAATRCAAAATLQYTHIAAIYTVRCMDPPFPQDQMEHYRFHNKLVDLVQKAQQQQQLLDGQQMVVVDVKVPHFLTSQGTLHVMPSGGQSDPIQVAVQLLPEDNFSLVVNHQTLHYASTSFTFVPVLQAIQKWLSNPQ